uniref:5-oxoprolinase n=1 Tax=Catharus ustulatus TaxID=91951 RepID=A0A8C3UN50_CATUS
MAAPLAPSGFQFAIDRGGTFTDVFARCPGGRVRVLKLLSEDPAYRDAPTEGIRRILQELGVALPRDQPLDGSQIQWIRMGTTVATNALLQRRGERTALAVTRGFRHLLHIGTQARPHLFDLEVAMPDMLYEEVIEVDERIVPEQPDCCSGVTLLVQKPLDLERLRGDLEGLLSRGFRSLAVLLLHSYAWPEHEEQVAALALQLGFSQVSLSSGVARMARAVPRGLTACVDAYLSPGVRSYLHSFCQGFRDGLQGVRVLFMRSDGGLTPMARFRGSQAILSGPAAGVVGYARTTFDPRDGTPVIGFDMGGTSTDVSRFAGALEHVFEASTAGVSIQAPQLDINTVAAGGGSRLFFRWGGMAPVTLGLSPDCPLVSPGGPLTVTDANLVLGRLLPEYFPRIFGPGEDQPLCRDSAVAAFRRLAATIGDFRSATGDSAVPEASPEPPSVEEVALGFIRVANEAMCRPIRALTQARGHDASRHILACFGGAGGQHACAIARTLRMARVCVHRHSGLLSALGLALADVVHEEQEPCALPYGPGAFPRLEQRLRELERRCRDALRGQGFADEQIVTEPFLHMRYEGTDGALMVSARGHPARPDTCQAGDFLGAFTERYRQEFGFALPGRAVLVDDLRVRGTGSTEPVAPECPPQVTQCYFEGGYQDTPVYLLEDLGSDHVLPGPAIIIDTNSTIVVEPGCVATMTPLGDINIAVGEGPAQTLGTELDPVQLSIFSHRFMSIADGAHPAAHGHLHQHQGAPRLLVRPVRARRGARVQRPPHPRAPGGHAGGRAVPGQGKSGEFGGVLGGFGGPAPCSVCDSHLSLTCPSPVPYLSQVFWPGQPRPVFFVASRGHHADVGGSTPGSMPPHSQSLRQEGAVFVSFKLVTRGQFQEQAVTEALLAPGAVPGCSGTRNLRDNLADLRAQVAANQKGIGLVRELIGHCGLEAVQAYMGYVQDNAEVAVRDTLRAVAARWGSLLQAEDSMDDGTPIRLRVELDPKEGSAVFDFGGTGPEVLGNCNAPRAITLSALIYCLRCLVGHDIPLNQGCLAPVQVLIPPGSILDPSPEAAVVGGNVLTSQRLVDVVLRAFGVCAASQGCMNNVTFGSDRGGYYETVAGGAGAGPHWEGRSGVHTHMTNTRITDPEILELRYPVVLRRFELRAGSGGAGRCRGGDGVIRELQFRRGAELAVLSERRATRPYGMAGGLPGAPGLNLLLRRDGRVINVGGKGQVSVEPGVSKNHQKTPK